jgi:hypothetical protein
VTPTGNLTPPYGKSGTRGTGKVALVGTGKVALALISEKTFISKEGSLTRTTAETAASTLPPRERNQAIQRRENPLRRKTHDLEG